MKAKALFIGVDRYEDSEIRNLECASCDAKELAACFTGFGFDSTVLLNPKRYEVEQAVKTSTAGLGPGDVFLFFFAGHGFAATGGQDLLFCSDDKFDYLRYNRAGIPFDLIRDETGKCGCHRLFLLDACRSDFQTGLRGAGGARDLCPLSEMAVSDAEEGAVAILRSCKQYQCSRELSSHRHGLFTLALMDVLGWLKDVRKNIAFDDALRKSISERMRKIGRLNGFPVRQEPEFMSSGQTALVLDPQAGCIRLSDGRCDTARSDGGEACVRPGDTRLQSARDIIKRANDFIRAQAYERAFALLSGVQGNCEVLTTLGMMKLDGLGCQRNTSEGILYLRQAAESGSSRALFQLYYRLKTVDRREALRYLTMAADRDDLDALFVLADEYKRAGDFVNMQRCYLRGARLGDRRAVVELENQRRRGVVR